MNENGNGNPTLLDYLRFGGNTATGIFGALNQPKPATPQASKNNWALIGGIAAAAVGLLLLVLVVSKK